MADEILAFCPLWGHWMPDCRLGEGSFGTVWKMRREEMGKVYYAAVKHISVPKNEEEIQHLRDEGIIRDDRTARTYYDSILRHLMEEIDTMYRLKGNTNIVSYEDHEIRPKDSGIGYDIFLRMEVLRGLPERAKDGLRTEAGCF